LCALQYKELEAELKGLKESVDTAQNEADQESQRIIGLEANVAAADEKRRSCRKQHAEVRVGAGHGWRLLTSHTQWFWLEH
jgi:chromosome segregation ATPase